MANRELPVLQASENEPQVNSNEPQVKSKAKKPRLRYDCSKCTAYCCSYDWILVTKPDIRRLAKHFNLTYEKAETKFTKFIKAYGYRVLRHKKDHIFKSTCQFLDQEKRACSIYEHRPKLCRTFPEEKNCGYYDFLMWERKHQDDEEFIPMQR